jgi:hypothetical protein
MKLPLTGGCQCSALRYEISHAPSLVYTCHCTECQRQTGSAFSMGVVIETEAFILSGARPRPIQRTADSGRTVTRWVCPECGSWICNGPDPTSTAPGERRVVRAGTLDDTFLATPDGAFLDAERAAVDHPPRRGPEVREATRDFGLAAARISAVIGPAG